MTIRQIRHKTGLTQKDFCCKYSIPLKTLQNWEADEGSAEKRNCPNYVIRLLNRAIIMDYPRQVISIPLEKPIDERHLKALEYALTVITKFPLYEYIEDVILYGSTARGEASDESDVDLLIVLSEEAKKVENSNALLMRLRGDISSDNIEIPETDLHFSFGTEWKESNQVFYQNVRTDGVSLWN